MTTPLDPGTHTFFHADRGRLLREGMRLELEDGLSQMGRRYWSVFVESEHSTLTGPDARECHLERVRTDVFKNIPGSRMTGIFGALTVEEAVWHGRATKPTPDHEIPIWEIHSSDFATYDRSWIDYSGFPGPEDAFAKAYWHREITNHHPAAAPRNPPRLEVLMQLPVLVGRQVGVC